MLIQKTGHDQQEIFAYLKFSEFSFGTDTHFEMLRGFINFGALAYSI